MLCRRLRYRTPSTDDDTCPRLFGNEGLVCSRSSNADGRVDDVALLRRAY